jgi:hypothetical protein
LPCFFVHSKPIRGDFTIQVLISHNGPLQLSPERFSAALGHVMLHGLINKPAALARLYQSVDGLDSGGRQNDVETFAHEN